MARILLVDDEQDLLDTVGVLLRHEGHHVVALRDGLEAMKLLQSLQEFDLLVTDLRMTPIDGMELIALAKRERPGMRILIVSAYLDAATEARAREAGCHRFVRKPFALNDLLDPIRDALLGKDDLTAELPSPEPRAIEDVSAQESSPVEEPPERRSPPPPPNDEWII